MDQKKTQEHTRLKHIIKKRGMRTRDDIKKKKE